MLVISSCSANKYLPTGELYYEGSDIHMESANKIEGEDKHETEDDIREVFRVDPNMKVLGARPRVWFHHLAGEVKKEKGFKYWMKYKLGEKPVYLSQVDIAATQRLVGNRLTVNGFFEYDLSYEIDSGRHAASIKYNARVNQAYRMDSIAPFEPDSLPVIKTLNSYENSQLRPGTRYDFEVLQQERVNRESYLRNAGYYFFADRFILFDVDSTVGDHKINVYPTFKEDIPKSALRRYRISEVNVNADYDWSAVDSVQTYHPDTTLIDNVNFIDGNKNFRPAVIIRHVGFRPGDIYNRQRELNTLNRLVQLGVFQYVNVTFEQDSENTLAANVFLSPTKKKSFSVTIEGISTSNNFAGPHLTASFLNRNFLGGAERLEVNLTTGYEWQLGGGRTERLTNYEVGIESIVTVPRLIQPFKIDYRNSRYIPVTKFKFGIRAQRRVQYYQMLSSNVDYGFEWRETSTKRHSLYPVRIQYLRLSQRTEEFDSLLNNNPYLQRSFDNQYIVGSGYSYYYSSSENKANKNRRHNYYFNGNLDLSGNLLYLTQNLIGSGTDSAGRYNVFGTIYSQFVRASVDFRHYWRMDGNNTLVSRFMTGAGYSFGNSETLPYSMQFSSGGSNSLRAFRARAVGPGSFALQDSVSFIDQTADIKLELNLEHRFAILGPLKGAVFLDAGNIWSFREDPNRPGAKFEWSNVLDQLAIGTGFGLRYDFEFFLIRLDWGLPLKLAYQYTDEEGNPKNFPIQPWKSEWLKKYLVWNIAIGHPF